MRKFSWLAAVCLALPLAAQQPAQPEPGPQEPGQGAQVHTGTTSGLDDATRLRNLFADHQYASLEKQLDTMPPAEAELYRGLLANRRNDSAASLKLLEPLAEQAARAGDKPREKMIRKAIAEDYLRLNDLAHAAEAYKILDDRLHAELTQDEREEIELPLKLLPLAAQNPPPTVEPCDPFRLQVYRNPLGLWDLSVWVDGRPRSWMLDPTAPFNLISASSAHEAGLKVSEQTATIHSLTGRSIQVRVAVIPRFTIGGRLTLRDMTVFVFDDADYAYPGIRYQVEGVLGFPALQAIGSLTMTQASAVEIRPRLQIAEPDKYDLFTAGAPFYLDGDRVLVGLGKPGDERMFAIDAAGQQTYLTARYTAEHAEQFTGQKTEFFSIPTAPDVPPQPAWTLETLPVEVGPVTVNVHFVQALSQPLGLAAFDDVYGVLGIDALDQIQSYTFDYRTMRFGVRPEQGR